MIASEFWSVRHAASGRLPSELYRYALDGHVVGGSALLDMLGNALGVAVAGVEDDCDLSHAGSPRFAGTGADPPARDQGLLCNLPPDAPHDRVPVA